MKEITLLKNTEATFRSFITERQTSTEEGKSFGEILKGSIDEVNELHQEADKAIYELVAGHQKDIHRTMIAMEKAEISLGLMMQVRNKIIAAYDEIKRMQF